MYEGLRVHVIQAFHQQQSDDSDLLPVQACYALLLQNVAEVAITSIHHNAVRMGPEACLRQLGLDLLRFVAIVHTENADHVLDVEHAFLSHIALSHELISMRHQLQSYATIRLVVINCKMDDARAGLVMRARQSGDLVPPHEVQTL